MFSDQLTSPLTVNVKFFLTLYNLQVAIAFGGFSSQRDSDENLYYIATVNNNSRVFIDLRLLNYSNTNFYIA